jgi:hypothetical protein
MMEQPDVQRALASQRQRTGLRRTSSTSRPCPYFADAGVLVTSPLDGCVSAIVDLLSLPNVRFATGPLMIRAHQLRSNVTPYDASYIALAEGLSCPLVSADARLAGARHTMPRRHPGLLTSQLSRSEL